MVIDLVVEGHVLGNQADKIHSERLYRMVPFERRKCSSTPNIPSVSRYTRRVGDAREVLEDPSVTPR